MAQKFWGTFVSKEDVTNFRWKFIECEIGSTLLNLITNSTEMKNKFKSFTEDQLIEKLELEMSWVKNNLSRYEYMMHMINHSTFHRGQVVTMARCLGIK